MGSRYTQFSAFQSSISTFRKKSFFDRNRPRSGRFGPRSVEVGQVEKNRPTPNTTYYLVNHFINDTGYYKNKRTANCQTHFNFTNQQGSGIQRTSAIDLIWVALHFTKNSFDVQYFYDFYSNKIMH